MKKLLLLLSGSLLLLSIGCAPVYRPTAFNVPMFDSADELQIALYTGTNGNDIQAAYSITDEVGVIVNGSFSNTTGDSVRYRKHNFGEAAIGYYANHGNGISEIYIGGGMGHSEAIDYQGFFLNDDSLSASGDYAKIFIQPSISLKSRNIQFGFVSRFSYIKFTNYTDNFIGGPATIDPRNNTTVFWEPALILAFGHQNFKFTTQWGFAGPLTNEVNFSFSPLILNVGIRFTIPQVGIAPKY